MERLWADFRTWFYSWVEFWSAFAFRVTLHIPKCRSKHTETKSVSHFWQESQHGKWLVTEKLHESHDFRQVWNPALELIQLRHLLLALNDYHFSGWWNRLPRYSQAYLSSSTAKTMKMIDDRREIVFFWKWIDSSMLFECLCAIMTNGYHSKLTLVAWLLLTPFGCIKPNDFVENSSPIENRFFFRKIFKSSLICL